jgi:hypothetical protein
MPIGAANLNGIGRFIVVTPSGKTVNIVGSGNISDYGKIGDAYYNQDGSAWLEIAQDSAFAFGTSTDFTMEGWFWHGGLINDRYFWDGRGDANSVAVLFDGSFLKAYIAGAYRISGASNALEPNTWNHIAYTRSGTTGTLWANGVSVGTWTDTTNYTHSNSIKVLSRYVFGQGSPNSYCDEFRISNTARYTGTFTPTTTGFSSDANTLLLLHLDSGTTVRTPKTITANGDVRIIGTQSVHGFLSAYFDGTTDYLSVTPTTDFATGTAAFTTEFRVRFSNTTTAILFDTRPASTQGNYQTIYWTGSTIRFYASGADRITSSSLSTATWYHVALVRSGDDFKLYINGTQSGSTFTSSASFGAGQVIIGADSYAIGTSGLTGYIDEFRFSNSARYTTTFTPTGPFTNDSNTLLLMHMGGLGNIFYDDAGYNALTDSTGSAYSSPGAGTTPPYPTTVSVRATATSTATTITVPSTVKQGDLLVLADTSTTTTDTTPSGWSQASGTTTTGIRTNISYKIATDADVSATVTGMAGTTRKVMVVYQGNYPFTSVRLSPTISAQSTTAAPSNQTITMSGIRAPIIAMAVYGKTTATTPTRGWSGGTPTEYSSVSTSGVYVNTLMYNVGSSPANATISMTDAGTNTLQSLYFRPF